MGLCGVGVVYQRKEPKTLFLFIYFSKKTNSMGLCGVGVVYQRKWPKTPVTCPTLNYGVCVCVCVCMCVKGILTIKGICVN